MKAKNTFNKLRSMGFDKVFDAQFDLLRNSENEEHPKFYLDKFQVSGVLPKKKGISEWLKANFKVSECSYPKKIHELFTADSMVSIDFLMNALTILSKFDEKVRIRMGKDCPISLETNEMRFIIAPRIATDNEIEFGYEGEKENLEEFPKEKKDENGKV